MTYELDKFGPRTRKLKHARTLGLAIIAGSLGATFFVSEISKILSGSPKALDYLYLALLGSLAIKIGNWIDCSGKELEIIGRWLDPEDYEPPSATAVILVFGITLTALVLVSRYILLFGVIYATYSLANLLGWWKLRTEMKMAISASRERLKGEDSSKAAIYGKALNLMEAYYLNFPHGLRCIIIFIAAATALGISSYAHAYHSQTWSIVAYVIFIFDILIVEELVVVVPRLLFFSRMRPVSASENERARATKENHSPRKLRFRR